MDPGRRSPRRRWIAAGVAAGLLAGAAAGIVSFTGAAPDPPDEVPLVLHAAPALVRAGAPVDLTLTSVCSDPAAPGCRVTEVAALVTPAGVDGATVVPGRSATGVWRVRVPAELVPDGGFSYAFRISTALGAATTYPPGGASPIRVLTTAGLPVRTLAAIDWDRRARPAGASISLRPGSGPARVGFDGVGTEGGVTGPSSFDVAADGTLIVADHVNDRLLRFSPTGRVVDRLGLEPFGPVDIALTDGGIVATTLGTSAEAFEVTEDGSLVGRYPVGYGVTSRVVGGAVPRVRVGSAQWVPVRAAPGVALTAAAQARSQTATVPLSDGGIGVSEMVGDRLAVVWTRPDGSRAGALVTLPRGVLAGADYLVRPLRDGGAIAVQGLWDPAHFGIGAIRFDAAARIRSLTLLPEPTARMAAPFSTVRFAAPDRLWLVRDAGDGMRIDRFRVR